MKYWAVIETKINGQVRKERSQDFDNQLDSESWLHKAQCEAKLLKVRVTDHYLCKK